MTDPTRVCPKCGTEILLTESLAAPIVAATRRQFEQQSAQKDEAIAAREAEIRAKEKTVAEATRDIDQRVASEVAGKVELERSRVVAEELTYSKSTDPASAHFYDQTELYSRKEWNRLPFSAESIGRQQVSREFIRH
ncbi:MAG: penicillin acylase family protein [Pseudomonadota bacterium]